MLNEMGRIGASGALGAASAYLFTNLNPLGGAAFGVVGRLVNEVTKPIFKFLYKKLIGSDLLSQTLDVTRFILLAGLTAAACSALGFPMTFSTALILQISQLAITYIGRFMCEFACDIKQRDNILVPAFALTPSEHFFFGDETGYILR